MYPPFKEITMTLNDVVENRKAFDAVEHAISADRTEFILRRLGPLIRGLLVWHFGAGWENRHPREIPIEKIQEFCQKYAS
jgi:hypothetical protein